MAIDQSRSRRKITGGRYRAYRKKKSRDLGREPALTKVGKKRVRTLRTRSGGKKKILLSVSKINVFDGEKYKKIDIKAVLQNPANRHFVRRNILTKGAVVDTEVGKVKITNRPGQENFVNGVLVK
tara:strand:- start:303 stop:677 length:375 start_codon:yes stop_codon:yes gene_type:complete